MMEIKKRFNASQEQIRLMISLISAQEEYIILLENTKDDSNMEKRELLKNKIQEIVDKI